MNKLLLTVIALFIATCAKAQTADTRNEISMTVGAGGGLVCSHEHHDRNIEHDRYGENYSPTLSIIYYRHLTHRWSLGARMTFMHWEDGCSKLGPARVSNDARHYCHAIMPAVKYYWLQKKHFRMHSSLAVGIGLNHQIQTYYGKHNGMYIDPAFDLTFLGFQIGGKHLSGIIDINEGTATLISAGLSYTW